MDELIPLIMCYFCFEAFHDLTDVESNYELNPYAKCTEQCNCYGGGALNVLESFVW